MFADRNHGDFVLFHSILDLPGILSPKENADYACQVLEQAGRRCLAGDLRSAVIVDALLRLDNPFTRLLAEGGLDRLPLDLITAALNEIALFQHSVLWHEDAPQWLQEWPQTACCNVDGELFANYRNDLAADFCCISPREVLQRLADAYQKLGVGEISRFTSFRWQGELIGVSNPDPITLDDLVGCEHQKAMLIENTEGFLRYQKGNNVLLYGERGTGKSSMIKAIANAYRGQGLCLIELDQSQVGSFRLLLEELRRHREKRFIVYLDDLSFDRGDGDYRSFKAILDGGASTIPENVLLYATSNRRHLVHETWQDRQEASDEIHRGDTMAEKLSLSDRFGMTLVFTSPAQEQYLNIVRAIAAKEHIDMPDDLLCKEALEWTLWHNARSGRTARQFINHLQGKGR